MEAVINNIKAVEFLYDCYNVPVKINRDLDEDKFSIDGSYDKLDNIVDSWKTNHDNTFFNYESIFNLLAFPTVVGSVIGGLTSYFTGESPTIGAADGAFYTGLSSSMFFGIKAMGILEKMKSFVLKHTSRLQDDMYVMIGQDLGIISNMVHYLTEVENNDDFQARTSIISYVSSYGKKNSSKIVTFGNGLLYGAFGGIVDIFPGAKVPYFTVITSGILGNHLRVSYISSKRNVRADNVLNPLLENTTEKDRNQLIGGLIERWYGNHIKEEI